MKTRSMDFYSWEKGLQVQMLNTARMIRDIFILMVNHASEFIKLLMHALYLFLELEVSCVSTPSLQKSIIIGQVAWNNLTTCEFPRIFFIYRAGRLEQFDHLRVPSHFIIGQVAWNNLTTCEFPRIFFSFIGQVAWNNLTTCEFPRILSSGRSPGTI